MGVFGATLPEEPRRLLTFTFTPLFSLSPIANLGLGDLLRHLTDTEFIDSALLRLMELLPGPGAGEANLGDLLRAASESELRSSLLEEPGKALLRQ